MEKSFWNEKWENNQIAFHESSVNPLLVQYEAFLELKDKNRIFVPLCGKTLDIPWLLSKGYQVVGVELIEKAVQQFFEELAENPVISNRGDLKCYSLENLDIFVGDIFNLSNTVLGSVDAVYDRAAFVALPPDMRSKYVPHVANITKYATQLLITYDYNQDLMNGPPFSFNEKDVRNYYDPFFITKCINSQVVTNGLKGHPATEQIWLLKKKT